MNLWIHTYYSKNILKPLQEEQVSLLQTDFFEEGGEEWENVNVSFFFHGTSAHCNITSGCSIKSLGCSSHACIFFKNLKQIW